MPIVHSLRARILLWVSVALVVLFAVTIVGLDLVFRQSSQRAVEQLLQVQLLGLIALVEETDDQDLTLPPDAVVSPQFGVPGSGFYGVIWDADGVPIAQSSSLLDARITVPAWPSLNEQRYYRIDDPGLPPLELLVMGLGWDFPDGHSLPYTFGVAASLTPYLERQAAFRRNLIGWFAIITLTMLAVLTGLMRFALGPLRRLERQVREVEAGTRTELTGALPTELVGLARNLNALIDSERRRLVRYRNTLDDLAHSLKTPLAAMRALLGERGPASDTLTEALDREVERMDQRVSYQLRRARASGATGLGMEPVRVAPMLEDVLATLDKVYREKQVSCELDVDQAAEFRGDPGDLSEILGNLLDNAYKYCRRRVAVDVTMPGGRLQIEVGDDGAGLPAEAVDAVLERGARADESMPGQGIGLAVVRETVELYGGSLELGRGPAGGMLVRVVLGRPALGA